ncbi:MAG: hypothetical protein RLZZ437_301 [Pseudomonadota bacterium]|jgi:UPF0716 protein FxsA
MPVAFALLLWPLIEIALFVTLGGWLGLWITLAIVLGTAVAGVALMRWRGMRALSDLRSRVKAMGNPLSQAADQVFFMFAGILLILPGFMTDFMGLLLLLPPVRLALVAAAAHRVKVSAGFASRGAATGTPDDVIDGDFSHVSPEPDRLRKPSGWTQD